jgi:dolichyl-phosphate-mannose--protein O-mannosyl transferase
VDRKIFYLFALILLFSLLIRLFRVTEPKRYYFDEVYHAVTAKAYADNNPDAYNPFAKAPEEGTAYDWLHPPLAKLIQAGSIKIFGDNPAGWRLPSVVFGTAVVAATFFLAFSLFGPVVALFSSAVIAFENLAFVMSRITMNDVFVTFFILVSFIYGNSYLKRGKLKDLVLAGIFLGLAVSSKWTGFYAVAAEILYIFIVKIKQKSFDVKIAALVVIPIIIYLLSYGQFWLQGNSVDQFIDLNKQIWWYQNRHDLEHSYGTTPLYCVPSGLGEPKSWCPWALDARGVYFSYEEYGRKSGYIYALGNPFIFWAGVLAVSFIIGKYMEEKKREYLLLLLGYFIFWVPWIFSPRILFLYHYLPSIPFLSISLGIVLSSIYSSKFKVISFAILLLFAVSFFYFYPITSGWPIAPEDIDKYMWFKTWR